MLVQYFCCCYHLRTGTIVLAWVQLMVNVLILAGAASPIPFISAVSVIQGIEINISYVTHLGFVLLIGEILVKSATCFALIWGTIQRNHFFMQPWLFLQFVENIVITAAFLALFITACFINIVFSAVLPVLIIGILNWYFWACVKTVYNEDYKPSLDVWGDFTDTSLQYRNSFRQSQNYGRPSRLSEFNPGIPRVN